MTSPHQAVSDELMASPSSPASTGARADASSAIAMKIYVAYCAHKEKYIETLHAKIKELEARRSQLETHRLQLEAWRRSQLEAWHRSQLEAWRRSQLEAG